VLAIAAQETPSARKQAILSASTAFLGLPNRLPLAFAAASPDRTRSRISSRSNSAMDAKIRMLVWVVGTCNVLCNVARRDHPGHERSAPACCKFN
jgi:hypothetical protein